MAIQRISRFLSVTRGLISRITIRIRHGFFPKRSFFLVFLIIVLLVLVTPQPADAFACGGLCIAGAIGAVAAIWRGGGALVRKLGSDMLTSLISFVNWLLEIIGTVLWAIAEATARFFTWVLVEFNQSVGFIDNDFVQVGWAVVRDVANWLFVIFFLVSAIATILNLQKYNARTILPKLILVAILVNFSLFITGFVVNISQIFTTIFVVDGAGQYGDIGLALAQGMGWEAANISVADIAEEIADTDLAQSGIAAMVYLTRIVFALASIFIFFWLALMLFVRVIFLWVAMILSPLAFASAVFPNTQPFFNDWLKQFTNWATFGVFASFFIWLAVILSTYLQSSFSTPYVISSNPSLSGLVGTANLLMRFITIFVFLWIAYSTSKKAAGKAGQFVEGAMKTALMGVGVAGGLAAGGAVAGLAGKGLMAAGTRTGATAAISTRMREGAILSHIPGISRLGQRLTITERERGKEKIDKHEREISKLTIDEKVGMATNAGLVGDKRAALHASLLKDGIVLDDIGVSGQDQAKAVARLEKRGQLDDVMKNTSAEALAGLGRSGALNNLQNEPGISAERANRMRDVIVGEMLDKNSDFTDTNITREQQAEAMDHLHRQNRSENAVNNRLDIAAEAGLLRNQRNDAALAADPIAAIQAHVDSMRPGQVAKANISEMQNAEAAGNATAAAFMDQFKETLKNGATNASHLSALNRAAGDSTTASRSLDVTVNIVRDLNAAGALDSKTHDQIVNSPTLNQDFRL